VGSSESSGKQLARATRRCQYGSVSVTTRKPTRVDKPWGHELWSAETNQYAGKSLVVNAGQALSLQYHREKDETSYLLSGKLRLIQGPDAETLSEREVEPGQAWRNGPGTVHSIEALEDSVVLEVSTPHLDGVVRMHDRYGRA
jgi:mannose-6-phosphate isomerase